MEISSDYMWFEKWEWEYIIKQCFLKSTWSLFQNFYIKFLSLSTSFHTGSMTWNLVALQTSLGASSNQRHRQGWLWFSLAARFDWFHVWRHHISQADSANAVSLASTTSTASLIIFLLTSSCSWDRSSPSAEASLRTGHAYRSTRGSGKCREAPKSSWKLHVNKYIWKNHTALRLER